jgi:thiosulfate/3-mercaptopyruvate sulfurtransferase
MKKEVAMPVAKFRKTVPSEAAGYVRAWLFGLLCALGAPAHASQELIASREQVVQALARGAIVWDVRDEKAFLKGHLPGAVNLGDVAKVLRDPLHEDLLPPTQLRARLNAAGVNPQKEVVVYGARGTWNPYLAALVLQAFGSTSVQVYHDGHEDWVAAGQAQGVEPQRLAPLSLELAFDARGFVDTRDVLTRLHERWAQVVDVRTPAEFAGTDIRAIRGGHIPGAINIPYEQNWQDPDTPAKLKAKRVANTDGMQLKDAQALKALYSKLDPRKETVVYCQSGARAALTVGVLQSLGFKNVRLYDASWLGYASRLDAPATNASFVNVTALNNTIQNLQNRLDAIEAANKR